MTLTSTTIDMRNHLALDIADIQRNSCGSKNIRHLDALEVSIKSVSYSLIFKSHAKHERRDNVTYRIIELHVQYLLLKLLIKLFAAAGQDLQGWFLHFHGCLKQVVKKKMICSNAFHHFIQHGVDFSTSFNSMKWRQPPLYTCPLRPAHNLIPFLIFERWGPLD